MNKEDLYKTLLISPTYKYPLLNEIYAIRNKKVEFEDYTIGVDGFISLDVLLEHYNQINMIEDLQHQLEEKDKVIDELRNYFNNFDVKSLEEQGLGVEAKEFIIIPLEIIERCEIK